METEPRHHAVGGAFVFDLEHGPLSGSVVELKILGHHAVEAGSFETREPIGGYLRVSRGRRQVHAGMPTRDRIFESGAPLAQRRGPEVALA